VEVGKLRADLGREEQAAAEPRQAAALNEEVEVRKCGRDLSLEELRPAKSELEERERKRRRGNRLAKAHPDRHRIPAESSRRPRKRPRSRGRQRWKARGGWRRRPCGRAWTRERRARAVGPAIDGDRLRRSLHRCKEQLWRSEDGARAS